MDFIKNNLLIGRIQTSKYIAAASLKKRKANNTLKKRKN